MPKARPWRAMIESRFSIRPILSFLFLRQTGFIKNLCHLVTGENVALQRDCTTPIIIAYICAFGVPKQRFSPFQLVGKLGEQCEQGILVKAHFAFVVPYSWEVHAAFEIGYADNRVFL